MKKIPLVKPFFDEKELALIKETLESGWIAGQGSKALEFGRKFSKKIGVKYSIPISNCTAGLHLGLLTNSVKKDDEIIVSDYTFPATGHSILYMNAIPRFTDIRFDTFDIDPEKIIKLINDKTRGIIPVHAFGQSVDLDPIRKIAEEYSLFILEDAACAVGTKYHDKMIGSNNNITAFSFHARKGMTTGEGGMITTNNRNEAERIKSLMNFGMGSAFIRQNENIYKRTEFTKLGYNYKLSDINCAIGIVQLSKLDKIIRIKSEKVKIYNDLLINESKIVLREEPSYQASNHQAYVILLLNEKIRNKMIIELRRLGISAQIGTYSSFIQPVYKSKDICPVSLNIFKRALTLPLFPSLSNNEIDYITTSLKSLLRN